MRRRTTISDLAEALRHGYRMGLGTPVVHAINDGC